MWKVDTGILQYKLIHCLQCYRKPCHTRRRGAKNTSPPSHPSQLSGRTGPWKTKLPQRLPQLPSTILLQNSDICDRQCPPPLPLPRSRWNLRAQQIKFLDKPEEIYHESVVTPKQLSFGRNTFVNFHVIEVVISDLVECSRSWFINWCIGQLANWLIGQSINSLVSCPVSIKTVWITKVISLSVLSSSHNSVGR